VISWASAGHVGFKGFAQVHAVRRPDGRRERRRKAQEHGLRKVDVFVKGRAPAARRRSARCRPPARGRPPSPMSLRSRTTAAVRRSVGGSDGSLHRTRDPYLAPPQRRPGRRRQAFERRPYRPASTAVLASSRVSTCCRCRRAEGEVQLRRAREAVPSLLRRGHKRHGKTGDNLLQILESRLDNVVYRSGLARTRRRRASSSATATSWSTGRRSTSELPRHAARHRRRQAEVARDHAVPDRP